ncbi:immune inhibitor A, partial [candidate division WOR-3 bacterium]|nr:immune inhibitor A [candidate division WOR-3 bacterium]
MLLDVLKARRVLLLVLLAGTVLSASWIPFAPDAAAGKPQVTVLAADAFSVDFEIKVHGTMLQEIDTREMLNAPGESFVRFDIIDAYHSGDVGKPQLPAMRHTIGVPYGARITVEVLDSEYQDIPLDALGIDQRIMPVLAPVLKCPGEKPVFVIDDKTYTEETFYPASIARIENDDMMRGHRLVVIETHPIQYNPVTQVVRCHTRIALRISFVGGDQIETRQRLIQDFSPVFEDFIKRRVLNYSFYENMARDVVPLPIHYLIITHNTFQTQVNDLAYWLKQKGFKVKVANQDSISTWNVAGIEGFINAQVPQPTYLLLVGDVNGGYMPAPTGSQSQKVTDLYYAETDGTGYLPDIFYGRLSVETPTHIATVVDKILKYEKANLPNMAQWFKKDAFLAGNDNYTVSEGTHNYCTTMFMDPNGYTTYKLYEQTYGATTADVFTNVNEGRILTTMSGHGSDDGWYDGPPFQVSHVNQLTNGDKLTIATGHCCLANNFGWNSGPCGGESWIRKAGGGGVAYYGACPSTYWSEDDWLQKEWYRAIYVDQIYEHGRFTLDGMYDGIYLSGTSLKQYYYEGYHVLGDPSLDLWTEVPVEMVVLYDDAVIPGSASFTVTVSGGGSPVENALVCAWIPGQSPEMHVAEYTNASGIVTLNIAPTTPGDTMYVTVTAHDFIPHQGHALVIAPSGPYITAGSRIINDGNNNQPNPGETIQLGLWAKNIGVAVADSVYGLLSESDDYVTVFIDSSWYGTIAPADSALSSPYYSFTIANNCPNGHNIAFTAAFTDAQDSTWTSNFPVTVYAPVLSYQYYTISGGNGNGVLEPGETANLAVVLKNSGGAAAEDVAAAISTADAYLTILTDTASYGDIPVDSTAQSQTPYVIQAAAAAPVPHVAQVVMNITGAGFVSLDTFQLVIGPTGFYDSVEDTAVTNQYTVQGSWHRTQRRSHSPTYSWWNGNETTGQYANNVNASIVTPSVTLATNSVFECWNWYYLESNYDYGYIELSTDGGTNWSQLVTFNGSSGGWVQYSTPLNYPAGTQIKIRFRLYTDYSVVYEGWYVDDIKIYDPVGVSESEFDLSGITTSAAFIGVYPNPFKQAAAMSYQVAASGPVRLRVYDALGRLVSTLVDAVREPGYYTVTWPGRDDQGRKVPA